MNIELKYKFKYPFTVAMLAVMTLFFGALGIVSGLGGIITVPLTAASLAALICIEKRRIVSCAVALILIVAELLVSIQDYFTLASVTAVLVAVIMAIHLLLKRDKSESALFATMATALLLIISVALYIFGTTNASSLSEIYDHFLLGFDKWKESTVSYMLSISTTANPAGNVLSIEYMNEVFDAYLHCIIAIVTACAFLLAGFSHKIFCALLSRYAKDHDMIKGWRFMPDKVFAYLYFALAFFTLFRMDSESVIDVSVVNLYIIFMFVFAYVGFKFMSAALSRNGRSSISSSLIVLVLTAMFSSFALQVLAIIGAFISAYRSKFIGDYTKLSK